MTITELSGMTREERLAYRNQFEFEPRPEGLAQAAINTRGHLSWSFFCNNFHGWKENQWPWGGVMSTEDFR